MNSFEHLVENYIAKEKRLKESNSISFNDRNQIQ